jgi:hypothetical protein
MASLQALWEHFHEASAVDSRSCAEIAKYGPLNKASERPTSNENLGLLLRKGVARVGRVVRLSRAAESKNRQNFDIFALKKL